MKIQIKDVTIEDNGEQLIRGITDSGVLEGRWVSDVIPIVGGVYHIELTLPDLYESDVRVLSTAHHEEAFCMSATDVVTFSGQIDEIWEDGVCGVRFAHDCLTLCDIHGLQLETGLWITFDLLCRDIAIYPYG